MIKNSNGDSIRGRRRRPSGPVGQRGHRGGAGPRLGRRQEGQRRRPPRGGPARVGGRGDRLGAVEVGIAEGAAAWLDLARARAAAQRAQAGGPPVPARKRSGAGPHRLRRHHDPKACHMTPAIEVRALGRRFGDVVALDGLDLAIAAGHRVRPARPQRRRQDDARAHPGDAAAADRRQRARARPRRRRRAAGGAPAHRPRRPVRRGRRGAHRAREPRDGRAAVPPARAGPRRRAASCSSASG